MNKRNNLVLVLFFVFITCLWIWQAILDLDGFLFHPRAIYSDVLISHWPNMQFIRDAMRTWGEFPLWNPLILSGAPLVGDPLFGIWYLPNWLGFLMPVHIAITILFWLHLAWAGIGMFKWMRAEGVGWGGALIAGVAFSGSPKLIGHIGLGHLGLISAVSWTPWLLLITQRLVLSIAFPGKGSLRWSAIAGAVASFVFWADPRWILPAAGLAILYALRIVMIAEIGKEVLSLKNAVKVLVSLLIFLGMSSGLALPMIEFTSRSTRANLSFEEITRLSLPINKLLGILIPEYGGWPETITFVGLVVVALAVIAVLGNGKGWLFWLCVAIGGLLFALGDQTPIYRVLFSIIPGFRYLRVPARYFFISIFSASTMAGIGFNVLVREKISPRETRRIRLGLVAFGGLLLLISVGLLAIYGGHENSIDFPWPHMILISILCVGIGFISLWGNQLKRVQASLWCAALILDLFLINKSLLEVRSEESLFSQGARIIESLPSSTGLERIFSPSYSIPQNVAAEGNLQLADGVNPLQLKVYWDFMAETIGFDEAGYSVTLPPFPDGDPTLPQYLAMNSAALGLLNVGTIVSTYPINGAGLNEILEVEGMHIYENSEVRPRAWIEPDLEPEDQGWGEVLSLEWSPNSILIKARGKGRLVLSEVNYPGWTATINGKESPITVYKGILRSVLLEDGESLVEFHYHPWTVFVGLGATVLTLIILCMVWWRR